MFFSAILWAIAFGICPQRPSHTLYLGNQQMPIEARMAGMFGGFVLGALFFAAQRRGRAWRTPTGMMAGVLVGFMLLLGADGLNAFLYDLRLPHLYTPDLSLRLGTGLLTGLTFAAFLVPAFNSTLWQTGVDESPIRGPRDLLVGLAWLGAYFVASRSGAAWLFFPVSLIAVAGVPLLLGAVAMIVVAPVLKRANCAERWRDLVPLAVVSLLLVVVALAGVSVVRYGLFGPGPLDMPMPM
jgi:hypothetical protein